TTVYTPQLLPSPHGESIPHLHNRLATALQAVICDLDAEIARAEATLPPEQRTPKAVLFVSHAASLIAMGRVLTGCMPEDPGVEDFHVFTAGLSRFSRRRGPVEAEGEDGGRREEGDDERELAPGTRILRPGTAVPDWTRGRGVGGGWDCVANGDCSFLSCGAERGWHFNGEESFDTPPFPPPMEVGSSGTKL
ncbi:phosphoglycerate mutase family protein, partial [Aspergillus sp. HF37]